MGYRVIPVRKILRRYHQLSISRTPSESPSVNGDIIRRTVGLTHTPASLRKKQAEDTDIEPILLWKSRDSRPYGPEVTEASPSTRHYWNLWESLELREGVLYRRFHRKDGTSSHLQFVVPKSVRDEILHELHNNTLSGHLGRKKCRERALQRFYWHGIREDINVWVAKCDECASIKIQGRKAKAPLGCMIVGAVWDRLGVDILGPLPLMPRGINMTSLSQNISQNGLRYFLSRIKQQWHVQIKYCMSYRQIWVFTWHTHWIDQGRQFESQIFAELCKMLEVRKTRTSAANPRSNGVVERLNRTLISMIKAFVKGEQTNWDKHLSCLASAYRSTPNENTHMTPNLIMFGREVHLPIEVLYLSDANADGEVATYGEYVHKLRERLQRAHAITRRHLGNSANRQKQAYDAKLSFHQYNPGDLVWYFSDLKQIKTAPN